MVTLLLRYVKLGNAIEACPIDDDAMKVNCDIFNSVGRAKTLVFGSSFIRYVLV